MVPIDTGRIRVSSGRCGRRSWPSIWIRTQSGNYYDEEKKITRRSRLCDLPARWRKTYLNFEWNPGLLACLLRLSGPLWVTPKVRKQSGRCKLPNLGQRDLTWSTYSHPGLTLGSFAVIFHRFAKKSKKAWPSKPLAKVSRAPLVEIAVVGAAILTSKLLTWNALWL